MTAMAILTGLVGYSVAVKLYTWFKMIGIKIDNMDEQEIRDLLEEAMKDKNLRKYMR